MDYNKLVLRKYIVYLRFSAMVDFIAYLWKHEYYVRVLLDENFKKDYWYYTRYIYLPRHLNILNTPNVFIEAFSGKLDKNIFKLLNKIKHIDWINRLGADYNNIFFYIKYRFDKLLFIISKYFWHIISKTRFSSRTNWLIKTKNLEKYLEIAKPWDIFLTRWNWNASNISIPGFWKHMSMYLWTWKYLKNNFKWDFLKDLKDWHQYIIEATWNGINIVDIYDFTSKNDYLWVFRTTFKSEKILRTIKNSLTNLWKWYDHIFNFYSDKKLVCTALVLKSYAKEFKNDEWIDIELEKIGISLTYPPNNFVKKVAEEWEKKNPILKWVFFIDSLEKDWSNFVNSIDELLLSRTRPKLSIFLK